jgi:transcription initiation factor TFIIIB Brf1 subunit/transcription initiation factor TFIIB
VYRARDRVDEEERLSELDAAAETLGLAEAARTTARDIYLTGAPESERSKSPALAASLYAAALVEGDQRSQGAVAEAVGVSRVAVQQRWKDLLREAGLEAPSW